MDDYGNYKPQEPLSSRLRVDCITNTPNKVKRHRAATAALQALPEYIHPIGHQVKPKALLKALLVR